MFQALLQKFLFSVRKLILTLLCDVILTLFFPATFSSIQMVSEESTCSILLLLVGFFFSFFSFYLLSRQISESKTAALFALIKA